MLKVCQFLEVSVFIAVFDGLFWCVYYTQQQDGGFVLQSIAKINLAVFDGMT